MARTWRRGDSTTRGFVHSKCHEGAGEGWLGQGERQSYRYSPPLLSRHWPYVQTPFPTGITNQRETTIAWSRTSGKPLCRAIVWTDSRTKNTVAHYEKKLEETGIEVNPGEWKKGKDGVEALRQMCVLIHYIMSLSLMAIHLVIFRTGLPLSTYFSAIKLRWMIDHYPDVAAAHESDDLLFGTVESWVLYVSCEKCVFIHVAHCYLSLN